ncbi:unnamed protein product, partial [Meganyctiphanes norvegica]
GREVSATSEETVRERSGGGWVTTSRLEDLIVRVQNHRDITVECQALSPILPRPISNTTTLTIISPPGTPELEGDFSRDLEAGMTMTVSCKTRGGHPRPTVRVLKGVTSLPGDAKQAGDVTWVETRFTVTPADNGLLLTCEVTNPATSTPRATSRELTVMFGPSSVSGSVSPTLVEEGETVTLSCEAASSLPPANISWHARGTPLLGATQETKLGAFGGTIT